ncbi:MAG: RagB/SusD family nutrient uptake outer membrane protein [Paludibacter sp.]
MKKYIYLLFLIVLAYGLNSCADFLDKVPDSRTTIDSKKKIRLLLVSAYSDSNYSMLGEISSDNMIDNNSPDATGFAYQKATLSKQYDEAFAWNDVVSSIEEDSPYSIWDGCYKAIAVDNAALDAIAKLEAEGVDMNAEKGEALISRAYHHFVLVNVFGQAYKDNELSKTDLGVPYATKPETVVSGNYKRLSVAEVYQNIKNDIDAGIDLVSDEYYTVPKYHFNQKAAHAFAARFYLYMRDYDKVIYHANKVLGSNASTVLFKTYDTNVKTAYPTSEIYEWIDATDQGNLLLMSTLSTFFFSFFKDYCRYAFNRDARTYTFKSSGPNWSDGFPGVSVWSWDSNLGGFVAKLYYFFEFTDKNAGIGYVHGIKREFTTNETLLCRAEAYLYKGNKAAAVADLNAWTQAYYAGAPTKTPVELTAAKIESFYNASATNYVKPLNTSQMSPSFIVSPDIEPYIQCVLHFRRIETIHDGLRWFDLKRYGIEITHKIGADATTSILKWNDERRAIQLPQEVIIAGMTANPRTSGQTAIQQSPGYCTETKAVLAKKGSSETMTKN